jgi:pimeloyl-ACP methyl ester carboxylesterase
MLVAGAFLIEFLTAGEVRPLSRSTGGPNRTRLEVPGFDVDRYVGAAAGAAPLLVLVHGLTPDGKDDSRLVSAANLLARAGFDVAVPTIPGLTRWRLRPQDRDPVAATLAARDGPTVVVGISVGAGPALLAAALPSVRDRARTVVTLGGYASALELVRFYLTGDYGYDGVRGRIAHDRQLIRAFVDANADVLDPSARRVLAAPDPVTRDAALARLSPALTRLLDAVSPERVVRDLPARLILIHGRDDRAVPYSETLRLAAARPARTRVVLVGAVGHVEAHRGWSDAHDLVALWSVIYSLIHDG